MSDAERNGRKATVRVASGQGFWGDWLEAPRRQVEGGPTDYLMLDYLAEVTMSILQKQKERDPQMGYARDFIGAMQSVFPAVAGRGGKDFEVGFHGEYREIVPNEKVVYTEVYEGAPPGPWNGFTPATAAAAGGAPGHLVSLHVYTTEVAAYRAAPAELGAAYRRHLGRHYVATALFEVAGLFDPAAKVELVGIAVVPDQDAEEQP